MEPPPPPVCKSDEKLCGSYWNYACYSPSTHSCLTFSDGSGGTVCPLAESFCGGKCLSPTSGKVCVSRGRVGSADEWICNAGEQVCGLGYCYSPESHDCVDGNYICSKGQHHCGRECYTPSNTVECLRGKSGWHFLCTPGQEVCGSSGCYNPQEQNCVEGNYGATKIERKQN